MWDVNGKKKMVRNGLIAGGMSEHATGKQATYHAYYSAAHPILKEARPDQKPKDAQIDDLTRCTSSFDTDTAQKIGMQFYQTRIWCLRVAWSSITRNRRASDVLCVAEQTVTLVFAPWSVEPLDDLCRRI